MEGKIPENKYRGTIIRTSGAVTLRRSLSAYCVSLHVDIPKTIISRLKANRGSDLFHVLDIGCGTGAAMNNLVDEMRKTGASGRVRVMGIDKTHQPLISDKGHNIPHAFTYVTVDFMGRELKDKFDLILANQSFHYILEKLEAVTRVYNSLKPGGEAYIQMESDSIRIKQPGGDVLFFDLVKNEQIGKGVLSVHSKMGRLFVLRVQRDPAIPSLDFPYQLINGDINRGYWITSNYRPA